MRRFSLAAMLAAPCLCAPLGSGPALAEVSAAEAQQVLHAFAPVVGQAAIDAGAVTVDPHGDDYAIGVDFSRFFSLAPIPGVVVNLGRVTFLAHPLADGDWQVDADQLLPAEITLPSARGPQTYSYTFSGFKFSGVYDPSAEHFRSSQSSLDKLAMTSHAPTGDADVEMDGINYGSVGTTNEAGFLNQRLTESIASLKEMLQVTPLGANSTVPRTRVDVTVGKSTVDLNVDGLRNRAFMNLWTFLVSHGDQPASDNGDALKALIADVMPIFDGLDLHAGMDGMSVNTPVGIGTVRHIEEHLATSGLQDDASVDFGFGADGITLPNNLLPADFSPLVPTGLALGLRISGFDLGTPAAGLLKAANFGQPMPLPSATLIAVAAAMATHGATVSVDGTEVKTALLDLMLDGGFDLGLRPHGQVTLQAKGLNAAIDALRSSAARNPLLRQTEGVLLAARQLARIGADDQAVWLVDYNLNGTVTVNGKQVWANK